MDYLENRLGDDVMSIIYKKIHKDKYEDILWTIRQYNPESGCWTCDTTGFTVQWGNHGGNHCYKCNNWLDWSDYMRIPLSKNFMPYKNFENFSDKDGVFSIWKNF
jgi:hypothetical protein